MNIQIHHSIKRFLLYSALLLIFAGLSVSCSHDAKEPLQSEITLSPKTEDVYFESSQEVISVTSFDDYTFEGKLTLPGGKKEVDKLVLYVNGSGANTYDNKRDGFTYFDFFADAFSERGIAFFSYNTRGCEIGTNPPMYVDINEEAYQTYLPLNTVEDVYYMIQTLRKNERLAGCSIYLLGWSEGTIIAPLVAEAYPDEIAGLLLAGYVNRNMKDVLIHQNSGGISMAWYRGMFSYDELGRITKQSYEADPNHVIATVLQNTSFELLDTTQDGYLSEEDFSSVYAGIVGYTLEELLAAIERKDDQWLKVNYAGGLIPLTSAWFSQHFTLRSNSEVLPTLDLPIFIFQGKLDQNVDFRDALNMQQTFETLGKTNLTVTIFEQHDHDLNYMEIIYNNTIPEGISAILNTVSAQ